MAWQSRNTGCHGQKTQTRSQICTQAAGPETLEISGPKEPTSVSSQRSYDHAIRQFIDWYYSEPRLAFNRMVVTRYRMFLEQAHCASSTINLRLAAVRRLAYEAADSGLLSPDLAAGIRRVKVAKKHGTRVGNWLTVEQGKALLSTYDRTSLGGKRDYAMVAILLGCGLRRAGSDRSPTPVE